MESLNNLPDDILIFVLCKLNTSDLKNVMELNSAFYDLVFFNQKLWSKFKLRLDAKTFNGETLAALLRSDRTFHHVNIVRDFSQPSHLFSSVTSQEYTNFYPIFKKFGKDVNKLKISTKCLHLDFVLTILRTMPNIETISFCNEGVLPGDISSEAIPMLNLKTVQFEIQSSNNFPHFIRFFDDVVTLETISISSYMVYIDNYLPLLKKQRNLKKLTLNGKHCKQIVADLAENSYFSLKSFNFMNYSNMNPEDINSLAKFLNNQQEIDDIFLYMHLLESMDPVIEAILKMKTLNHVYLELIQSDENTAEPLKFYGNNVHVKSMILGVDRGHFVQKLVDAFPSLENLDITLRNAVNAEITDFTVERLNKLKKIKISMQVGPICLLQDFKLFGKLREFILFEVTGSLHDWSTFFSQNPNLESIEMVGCRITNEIIEAAVKNLSKLTKFVCYDTLGLKGITALLENCKSLKKIVVGLESTESMYAELFKQHEERLKDVDFKKQYRQ